MSSPARSFREPAHEGQATAPAAPQTQLQVQTRRRAQAQVQAVWRARALRYVLIYLLMACVLVTLRYQARAVYPNLHRLNATLSELQHRQSELSLTVQSLTSEQRVRTWALEHGMVPYAQASKQMKTFEAGVNQAPALPVRPVPASVTVRTVWR